MIRSPICPYVLEGHVPSTRNDLNTTQESIFLNRQIIPHDPLWGFGRLSMYALCIPGVYLIDKGKAIGVRVMERQAEVKTLENLVYYEGAS